MEPMVFLPHGANGFFTPMEPTDLYPNGANGCVQNMAPGVLWRPLEPTRTSRPNDLDPAPTSPN